jgi:hypothetical protein
MQQDQERIGGVLSPDHHPPIDPAQMQQPISAMLPSRISPEFVRTAVYFLYVSCSNNRMITNLLGAARATRLTNPKWRVERREQRSLTVTDNSERVV